jgi:hypothetical protein
VNDDDPEEMENYCEDDDLEGEEHPSMLELLVGKFSEPMLKVSWVETYNLFDRVY